MAKQTGSFDFNSVKSASQKATSFIFKTTGKDAWICDENRGPQMSGTDAGEPYGPTAEYPTTGWRIGDVFELVRIGVSWFKLWVESGAAKLRLGREDSGHLMLDANGMDVRTDASTSVASFGSSARVGKTNGPRVEIATSGVDLFTRNTADTADVELAHLGYASGTAESGTDTQPYYTFGTRSGTKGNWSVVEGTGNIASGYASHAEGKESSATNSGAHAEGFPSNDGSLHYKSTASGYGSHAENASTASGAYAHSQGADTVASGWASHAGGKGTIASRNLQTVIGRYNYVQNSDAGDFAFIVGNGLDRSTRSNALQLEWDGNLQIAGHVKNLSGTKLYADASHSHAAGDITSGTLGIARGGTGATTASDAWTNLGGGSIGKKNSLSTSDVTGLEDSGWQTLANTNSTIKYRKHHGVVYVAGISNNGVTISNSGTLVGTLPTGYRPTTDISGSITTTTSYPGQFTIGTGGGITLWNFGGSGGYWRFTVAFPV